MVSVTSPSLKIVGFYYVLRYANKTTEVSVYRRQITHE